ncbi:MAG: hypothetical protein FWC16_01920 [Defluviitaleaceae bacterium]|nr:hypothetical protein [Defluviitaleaceae bacterium]MCL2273656.1 hypothetical protein [Defluviitaleaceae bacterium]
MFNKGIHSTILTSDVADKLFSNISAISASDVSFIATLRALLRKRLPQDEYVHLNSRVLQIRKNDIAAASVHQCMEWFAPDSILYTPPGGHGITITYTAHPDAGEDMLRIIKANTGTGKRYMSNYTRRDDLQVFYARKAKALFYTDDAEKNTVIFTDRLELKHFHVLQMMIPKYLPRLFVASPLTEVEVCLLKSLGNKSAVEYEALIAEFAKAFDIRTEIIRSRLAGFETVFERIRADELRKEIDGYQNDYDHHLYMMQEFAGKIQESTYTLAGLESVINEQSEDSVLMEYFMCNTNLNLVRVTGTIIEFVAHGYADVYDPEAFEQYVGNHNGYMYNSLSPTVTKPQMEKLYRAIFGDCQYKLRLCAAFTADIKGGLRGLRSYVFPPESQTYLHNPHIQGHGCIGTYAGRFAEYMRKRDYVGGIEQATISAKNLNFYDSTVMSYFARELSRTAISCIEKPDGTLLTPLEAIIELEGGALCQDQ